MVARMRICRPPVILDPDITSSEISSRLRLSILKTRLQSLLHSHHLFASYRAARLRLLLTEHLLAEQANALFLLRGKLGDGHAAR